MIGRGNSLLVAVTAVILLGGCSLPTKEPRDDTEASLLTRYTLAQCLARAYPDTPTASDAGAAAGGYLEFGDLAIEPYEAASRLAADTAAQRYTGKHGEPLHAMKCLDLLVDPRLEHLLDQYAR